MSALNSPDYPQAITNALTMAFSPDQQQQQQQQHQTTNEIQQPQTPPNVMPTLPKPAIPRGLNDEKNYLLQVLHSVLHSNNGRSRPDPPELTALLEKMDKSTTFPPEIQTLLEKRKTQRKLQNAKVTQDAKVNPLAKFAKKMAAPEPRFGGVTSERNVESSHHFNPTFHAPMFPMQPQAMPQNMPSREMFSNYHPMFPPQTPYPAHNQGEMDRTRGTYPSPFETSSEEQRRNHYSTQDPQTGVSNRPNGQSNNNPMKNTQPPQLVSSPIDLDSFYN